MKKSLPVILGLIVIACVGAAGYYFYTKSQKEESSDQREEKIDDTESESQTTDPGEAPTTIENKDVLLILGPDGYNDQEYTDTKAAIENANNHVITCSKGVTTANGMSGGSAKVDIDISNVKVADYIAIVFIGGSGAHEYFNDNTALNLAKEFYNAGKVTAAICSAPTILANAGLLDGKKATCFPGYENNLTSKGAIYTAESVTVEGMIVTGEGPDTATEFGERIVELIKGI